MRYSYDTMIKLFKRQIILLELLMFKKIIADIRIRINEEEVKS